MENNKIKEFAERVYDVNAMGEKHAWDKDSYVNGFSYGYDAAVAEIVELGDGFISIKELLRKQRISCEQEMRARLQSHYRAIPEQDISYVIINAPEPFESRPVGAQVSLPSRALEVCANCKWLVEGVNKNYYCDCQEAETVDMLIILKDTFGCNKFEARSN